MIKRIIIIFAFLIGTTACTNADDKTKYVDKEIMSNIFEILQTELYSPFHIYCINWLSSEQHHLSGECTCLSSSSLKIKSLMFWYTQLGKSKPWYWEWLLPERNSGYQTFFDEREKGWYISVQWKSFQDVFDALFQCTF